MGSAPTPLILVVEDEPGSRRGIRVVLEAAGHAVVDVGSGRHALQLARALSQMVELLVIDLDRPGMAGWELADALDCVEPRLPVLFISGNLHELFRAHQRRPGTTAYLPKPFDARAFLLLVERLLPHRKDVRIST